MVIGAQLYTIHDYTKDLVSFSESLKKIADIGYTKVQVSGTCPYEADWLKEELDKNRLECVITHVNPDSIKNDVKKVCRDHEIFGCKNIGIGSIGTVHVTDEHFDEFVKTYLPLAEKIKENGHKFFLHNHDMEFARSSDGKVYMDKFIETFPADLLGITFDTYWAQYAGADPALWIDKLKGRIECIHLKDMTIVNREQRMAPVGSGNMNFERIIERAEGAGVEYLLVEQDNCYGEDPFACLAKSYAYLTSLGLKA